MKLINRKSLQQYLCGLIMITAIQAFGQVAEGKSWNEVEKDLDSTVIIKQNSGEAPAIITSRPYELQRLFTTPTAYALRPYGLRFGGKGNIHSTLAHMNTNGLHASISVGLGGVAELGYQMEEYYTVGNYANRITR